MYDTRSPPDKKVKIFICDPLIGIQIFFAQ